MSKRLDILYYPLSADSWHISASLENTTYDLGGTHSEAENLRLYGKLPICIPWSLPILPGQPPYETKLEEFATLTFDGSPESKYKFYTNNCSHHVRKALNKVDKSITYWFAFLPWATAHQACQIALRKVELRKRNIVKNNQPPDDVKEFIVALTKIEIERLELCKCQLQLDLRASHYRQIDQQQRELQHHLDYVEIAKAAKKFAQDSSLPQDIRKACEGYDRYDREEAKLPASTHATPIIRTKSISSNPTSLLSKKKYQEAVVRKPIVKYSSIRAPVQLTLSPSTRNPNPGHMRDRIKTAIVEAINHLTEEKIKHQNDFFTKTYMRIDQEIGFLKRTLEKHSLVEQYQLLEAGLPIFQPKTQSKLQKCVSCIQYEFKNVERQLHQLERKIICLQVQGNYFSSVLQQWVLLFNDQQMKPEGLYIRYQQQMSLLRQLLDKRHIKMLTAFENSMKPGSSAFYQTIATHLPVIISSQVCNIEANSKINMTEGRAIQFALLESELRAANKLSVRYQVIKKTNKPHIYLNYLKNSGGYLPMTHIRTLAYLGWLQVKLEKTFIRTQQEDDCLEKTKELINEIACSPSKSIDDLMSGADYRKIGVLAGLYSQPALTSTLFGEKVKMPSANTPSVLNHENTFGLSSS